MNNEPVEEGWEKKCKCHCHFVPYDPREISCKCIKNCIHCHPENFSITTEHEWEIEFQQDYGYLETKHGIKLSYMIDFIRSAISRAREEERDRFGHEIERIVEQIKGYRRKNPIGVSGVYLDQIVADLRSLTALSDKLK